MILTLCGKAEIQSYAACSSSAVPSSVMSPAWMRMSPSGKWSVQSSLCVSEMHTMRTRSAAIDDYSYWLMRIYLAQEKAHEKSAICGEYGTGQEVETRSRRRRGNGTGRHLSESYFPSNIILQ
jgi:hypothetical protein